jgi:ERCC4-type nuclease
MIYIDSRESIPSPYAVQLPNGLLEGAAAWSHLFVTHRSRASTTIHTLPAADFAFSGHASLPSMVAVERKTLKDLLSSKRSGRLAGEQLPKLFDHYDPQLIFLLLESDYRVNPVSGYLEERFGEYSHKWHPTVIGRQAMLGLELDSFLNTISLKTPVTVLKTRNPLETVEAVCSLYHYFQEPLDKRHDHMALHIPQQQAQLTKAGTVRRVAYALDGIGWERSFAVADRVKNVIPGLSEMSVSEWAMIPGFGKVLAKKVYKELRGETD